MVVGNEWGRTGEKERKEGREERSEDMENMTAGVESRSAHRTDESYGELKELEK